MASVTTYIDAVTYGKLSRLAHAESTTIEKVVADAIEDMVEARTLSPQLCFCFTGVLNMQRAYAQEETTRRGHLWSNSVTKRTTHLVVGEDTAGVGYSIKEERADDLGIPQIDEREFKRLLGI